MRYSERITDSTKPGKYFFLLVVLSLLTAITAFGQSKEEKKLRVKAVKALRAENFAEAQEIYTDLLKLDANNPDYNYEMGLAIYEQGVHRGKAAKYLERAILNTAQDTLPEMFLFAGKSEQYGGNYDLAIDYFEQYLRFNEREGIPADELEEDVPRYIEMCKNGKVQFENNKDHIRIENMGSSINSIYQDYSPVVTNDESIILFTSRRDGSTGGNLDLDGKHYEDIYYSLNIDGQYTPASNYDSTNRIMNSKVNTDFHDATITYAGDESQLFIYRDQDVWVSKLDNGLWTVPSKALGRINSEKGFEPSLFITQDEQTMFVVSDLSSGTGGRDIYITTKDENGQWKSLINLGKNINTKFDEDAPFLTPDGNTLYFASNGHNSIGDYDIFKSELDENGNWGPAENLGPPINTPGHDRYFVTSDDGAIGYYSSDRDGGYGETDIYRIILDCKSVSATMINGIVYSEDMGGPVATVITIYDPATKEIINTYKTDSLTGRYEMRLKTEKTYGFKIDANGYLPHAGEFSVPQQCDYFTLFQEIKIDNLEDSNGNVYAQRAMINNAFFNVDQKIEQNYEGVDIATLDLSQKDSLRSLVAKNFNPIELTNYVQLLDIIDPNGIRLASKVIGDDPVSRIQTMDVFEVNYDAKIQEADKMFFAENLPEARAIYMIASEIKPEEKYPKDQIEIIQNKLVDQPFEANLSTMPEEVKAESKMPELVGPGAVAIADASQEEDWEALSAQTGYTQEALKRMTPEELKRLKARDPKLDYEEEKGQLAAQEKSGQTDMNKDVAEVSELEEVDSQLDVKEEETIVFRNILFDFDKSDLRKESIAELNKVSTYMNDKSQVEVQIDGHADWIGTVEYNMALSERRAKAAYNYLTDKKNVNENRLSYQYFGEAVPIAPNKKEDGSDNPEGRQLNRRCEFKIDESGTAENVVLKF